MRIKRIVVSYCLVLVATLLTEAVIAQAIAATFTISSGVYPGAPDYTVWKEGSTFYAKNQWGANIYSGSNVSAVTNSVMNSFDKNRLDLKKVAIIGDILFDGQIILHNRTVLDLTNARLKIPNNFDKPLIVNWWSKFGSGSYYYDNDITILGGKIEGNKENQVSGGIINFYNMSELRIRGLFLWEGKDYNLRLDYVYRSTIELVSLDSDGDGIYLNVCAQIIADIQSHGNKIGLRVQGSGDCLLRGSIYLSWGAGATDAGILLEGELWNTKIDFSVTHSASNGIRVVNARGVTLRGTSSFSQRQGVRLEGANFTTIEGYYCRSNSLGGTYEDLFLTNYEGVGSYYNTISMLADSTLVDWNIQEGGDSDWNLFYKTFTTKATGILMATESASSNSRIVGSYNGTVWIEHWGTG